MKKLIIFLFTLFIIFSNNAFADEDQENLINSYYESIEMGDFVKANSLLYKPKNSPEGLKKIYTSNGKILSIFVDYDSIKSLGNNKFNYKVKIWYKDKFLEEKYDVSAEIIDNKIRTYGLKQIKKEKIREKISYGNIKAYIENNHGIDEIFIEKDGKKILLTRIAHNIEELKDQETGEYNYSSYYSLYSKLKFLGNGKILNYEYSEIEYISNEIYIIDKEEFIGGYGALSLYGFTKDKKYFYVCGEAGMSGSDEFKIYNVKTWEIENDLGIYLAKNNSIINGCEKYDEKNNNLIYNIYNNKEGSDNSTSNYSYNFDTKKIKEIK